jgi:hypothetical protein
MEMRQQLVAGEARAMENDQQWRRLNTPQNQRWLRLGRLLRLFKEG